MKSGNWQCVGRIQCQREVLYSEPAYEGQGTGKQGMEDRWKVVSMCDVENKIWAVAGNACSVILHLKNNSFRFFIPMEDPKSIYYSKLNHQVVMAGNDGFISIRADLSMPKNDKASCSWRVSW